MKRTIYLNCFYKWNGHVMMDREEKLEKLARKFEGKDSGSGTNFKLRDVNYTFNSFRNAKKFYRAAKAKKWIDGANVSFWIVEDNLSKESEA